MDHSRRCRCSLVDMIEPAATACMHWAFVIYGRRNGILSEDASDAGRGNQLGRLLPSPLCQHTSKQASNHPLLLLTLPCRSPIILFSLISSHIYWKSSKRKRRTRTTPTRRPDLVMRARSHRIPEPRI
ncbi:hypothetical protein KCU65_g222, partial [Aureobasidium melanogenum]